jgi:hypothetical protein
MIGDSNGFDSGLGYTVNNGAPWYPNKPVAEAGNIADFVRIGDLNDAICPVYENPSPQSFGPPEKGGAKVAKASVVAGRGEVFNSHMGLNSSRRGFATRVGKPAPTSFRGF